MEELLGPPTESDLGAVSSRLLEKEWSPASRHPGYVYESNYPTGLARAPFVWEYRDKQGGAVRRWNMEFLGGFVGIAQDPDTLCLRPEIGWAVREGVGTSEGQVWGAG